MWRLTAVLAMTSLTFAAQASAQEWGTLKGRIVYKGDLTKPAALDITRDEDVCGPHNLVDESLIVNPSNRGLKNVVVWLSSKTSVPVHPKLSATPKPVRLDNKNCTFVPRIVRLRTDQILQATSSDPIAHNVAVYARRNNPFSEIIPKDSPLEKKFPREELRPIRVDCSIHSWMRAYLIITDHPYSAVTDKNGNFEIPNLPYGEWQFKFWHEKSEYLPQIQNGNSTVELKSGMWKITIDKPETNLPNLSVAEFKEEE